jgi:hypothetical protein
VSPYLGVHLSRAGLRKIGARRLAVGLQRLPPGFQTSVQREVLRLVQEELLELPPERGADALSAAILRQPAVDSALERCLAPIRVRAEDPAFRVALEEEFAAYGVTRAAAADLSCATLSATSGALAFGKLTPGALSAGPALAAFFAQHAAVSQFLLGPTLGAWYYGLLGSPLNRSSLHAVSTSGRSSGIHMGQRAQRRRFGDLGLLGGWRVTTRKQGDARLLRLSGEPRRTLSAGRLRRADRRIDRRCCGRTRGPVRLCRSRHRSAPGKTRYPLPPPPAADRRA